MCRFELILWNIAHRWRWNDSGTEFEIWRVFLVFLWPLVWLSKNKSRFLKNKCVFINPPILKEPCLPIQLVCLVFAFEAPWQGAVALNLSLWRSTEQPDQHGSQCESPRPPVPPAAPWRAARHQVPPLLPPESWLSSWMSCTLLLSISRGKMWIWSCAMTGNLLHWSLTGLVWWLSLSSLSSAPPGSSCWHPALFRQFLKISFKPLIDVLKTASNVLLYPVC